MGIGVFKKIKNFIGKAAEKIGNGISKILDHPIAKKAADIGGKMAGLLIPIPVVGGMIGKALANTARNIGSYAAGTVGKIGEAMQGKANAKDVLLYAPNKFVNDIKNSNTYQAITGQKTVPDAIMDHLKGEAMLDIFTPVHDAIFGKPDHSRTMLWVNKNGDASTTWKPGYNRIMWGDVVTKPGKAPSPVTVPDPSKDILGTYQGRQFIRGRDDATWNRLKEVGLVQ